MSREIQFAPRSRRDVLGIARFLANQNPSTARRFAAAAEQTFNALLAQPFTGMPFETTNPDLDEIRLKPVKRFPKYLIVYRVTDVEVRVLRVLHASQDIESVLEAE